MSPQQRYAHIDSLRAVAALLVVWTHAAEMFAPLAGGSWFLDVSTRYNLGRMGVVAFFGVSGFLIPSSLRADGPRPVRTFLVRRFFRLFPAYWLSIPLGVLALWTLFGQAISPRDIALNLTMVPDLFRAQPVMGSYWTLEYELAFYGLCLLFFQAGLLDRRYLAALATAGFLGVYVAGFAGLVVTGRQHFADLGVISLNFGCLFLGALWRRAQDGRLNRVEKAVLAGALALCWVVTPAACAYARYGHGSDNPFFVQFPVSYGVGVALFVAMTSFAKVRWRPLAWVGLVSYSLYLLHPVVTYGMRFVFDHHGPGAGLPVAVQMLAAAGLSIALAAAAFYGVERPAIAFSHRITGRPRDRAPAGAALAAEGRAKP
jgi:peptidoglycan/LPS O-acetylase OafA/YrhL